MFFGRATAVSGLGCLLLVDDLPLLSACRLVDGEEWLVVAQRRRGQDRSEVLPLQDLIPGTDDMSLADLEARSDGLISRARWGKWRNGIMIEFPEPATLEHIADTLNLDVTTVVLACAKQLGLDVQLRRNRLETRLPPRAADLSDEQIQAVLSVVNAMIDSEPRSLRAVARKPRGKR